MAISCNGNVNPRLIFFDSECVKRVYFNGIWVWPVGEIYRKRLFVDLECYAGKDIRDYCETEVWMLDKNREPIARYNANGSVWYEKLSSAHPNVPNTNIGFDGNRDIVEMEDCKYLRIFSTFKQESQNKNLDAYYEIQYASGSDDNYQDAKYKTINKNTIVVPRYNRRSSYYDYEVKPEDYMIRVFTYGKPEGNVPSKLVTRIYVQKKEEE